MIYEQSLTVLSEEGGNVLILKFVYEHDDVDKGFALTETLAEILLI